MFTAKIFANVGDTVVWQCEHCRKYIAWSVYARKVMSENWERWCCDCVKQSSGQIEIFDEYFRRDSVDNGEAKIQILKFSAARTLH